MAPTLLPCKLESRGDVSIYNPQRLLRQLVYDQGVVRRTDNIPHSSALYAQNKFVDKGSIPCRAREVVLLNTGVRRSYDTSQHFV